MPEAILTYEKPETLKTIFALANYLDFEILSINGDKLDDALIAENKNIDSSYLTKLFAEKNIDVNKLIKEISRRSNKR